MDYKQLKLRLELHTRIKTLASQSEMTANDYLDQLTINKPIINKNADE